MVFLNIYQVQTHCNLTYNGITVFSWNIVGQVAK